MLHKYVTCTLLQLNNYGRTYEQVENNINSKCIKGDPQYICLG